MKPSTNAVFFEAGATALRAVCVAVGCTGLAVAVLAGVIAYFAVGVVLCIWQAASD